MRPARVAEADGSACRSTHLLPVSIVIFQRKIRGPIDGCVDSTSSHWSQFFGWDAYAVIELLTSTVASTAEHLRWVARVGAMRTQRWQRLKSVRSGFGERAVRDAASAPLN